MTQSGHRQADRASRADCSIRGYSRQTAGVQCLRAGTRTRRAAHRAARRYVGYGADPDWAVTTVMDLVEQGAVAVLGNHDSAVGNPREQLNVEAQIVIEWTRRELGAAQRQFLANRPLTHVDGERLYVHSDASDPAPWIMSRAHTKPRAAWRSIRRKSRSAASSPARHLQHVADGEDDGVHADHQPAVLRCRAGAGLRCSARSGSADGNPAAAYGMLDTEKRELTYCRAPYDVEQAAAAIRKKGLPTWLANRLFERKSTMAKPLHEPGLILDKNTGSRKSRTGAAWRRFGASRAPAPRRRC